MLRSILYGRVWLYRLESSGSVYDPAAGCRVHVNEHVDISLHISSLFAFFIANYSKRFGTTVPSLIVGVMCSYCIALATYFIIYYVIKIEVKIKI